ncbi:gluconate 2-dehydrogenase subunit 3 family protein [Chitinophaga horti]|uniref:Gluconate 2-dehydrogenase subunit 3 family protein n=1 Tax=Chitinophaga horti TaxID=2920382 RepID=A0ABY6IZX7_9BACT|nr:gluconate 2-dehydrogenase subunit 3 family protein [Chitinophaga horti]UYQ92930.1 gluconate 2-dehydrogenase subunit 3 family protein [Chitinophaga horti]
MDRRESLKALFIGSISAGTLVTACDNPDKKPEAKTAATKGYGRTPDEATRDEKLHAEKFFTAAELTTIGLLANIIIPKDEHSGSATDAGVPDFIEFMAKDQPALQTPLRGGLRWLDVFSLKTHGHIFSESSEKQQLAIIDQIAYPAKAKPELSQGVSFFNLMRNLTATGFFTSEMGVKDLGYQGNKPNVWDGVPEEVLKQYNTSYDEKLLPLYIKPEDRGTIMTWDEA